ncbi:ABC-three component system middle component 2 [Streptomyces sp. C8S0]|uniref:ABC-three component system middle component 2 n=1 Tax=Streptomyces sp. C8S0 TaxID=2585716 RepID=UPI00299F83B3|nr:ABC-three component system middle component 2 [Streptomyces sp. C8S0]
MTEAFPARLDLAELVFLDHAMLHSGDLDGGPASLQPDLPAGPGELGLRRALVEQGLVVLMRAGLVEMGPDERGFSTVRPRRPPASSTPSRPITSARSGACRLARRALPAARRGRQGRHEPDHPAMGRSTACRSHRPRKGRRPVTALTLVHLTSWARTSHRRLWSSALT